MFEAKVYRVMVGSLSGAMEEVYVAKETIRKWNLENSEREGKLFLPVELSSKPEDFSHVDFLICIIGNRIENAVIVEYCLSQGKDVLLFFNAYCDPKNTIPSEEALVGQFRNVMQGRCPWEVYDGIGDLCRMLNDRLSAL